MNRKIVVMIPRLETALEDRIREKAGALGFSAEFYADETDARAAVADAEILVSKTLPAEAVSVPMTPQCCLRKSRYRSPRAA